MSRGEREPPDAGEQRRRYEVAGWLLFLVSAVAFVAEAVRVGDVLAIVASVFFLLGVLAFLTPICRGLDR